MKCPSCFAQCSFGNKCKYCNIFFCKNCSKVLYHNCSNIDQYYSDLKNTLKESFESKFL